MLNKAVVQTVDLPARVKQALDAKTNLRPMLFPFGFLITPAAVHVEPERFPFYGSWQRAVAGSFEIHHHPDQTVFVLDGEGETLFLIGHAYDPVTMIHDELEILQAMRNSRREGETSYIEALNRLTGIFATGVIEDGSLTLYGDAAGMQTVFYGTIEGVPYVTSHAALVRIILDLKLSEYVKRLTQYRFYHLFGRALPGDRSPHDELRRLVPNHRTSWNGGNFVVSRFFPVAPLKVSSKESDYRKAVQTAGDLLRNSMSLVAAKWDMPALSLTGGCDSQTSLACAVDNYEGFRYFSYASSPEEEVDASAAKGIADALGLRHEWIRISTDESRQRDDFDDISAILELNYGDIGPVKSSEVAKRIVLRESDIQVDVKSWVSEVARCHYHKRFAKARFPNRPTARYLTTLYKVFVNDRELVRMTDTIFQEYLDKYCSDDVFDRMDWWDLIFWEYRSGAWNGPRITGDHRFSFNVDIPFNNRLLLQALLATPTEARITDRPHRDIRELVNPEINKLAVSVVNVKHTKARSYAERAYLEVHSRLPF